MRGLLPRLMLIGCLWLPGVDATPASTTTDSTMLEWPQTWIALLQDLSLLPEQPEYGDAQLKAASKAFISLKGQLQQRSVSRELSSFDALQSSDQLASWIRQSQPQYQAFKLLQRALQSEQKLQNLPRPDATLIRDLSLGQSHPEVVLLRRLLAARLGEVLPEHLRNRAVWDPPLIDALKRYQNINGLKVTGTLTPATLGSVVASGQHRIDAIQYSLRQWLQLPPSLQGDSIIVNLPHFNLLVLQDNRVKLTLPVIVGSPKTPTPRFNSKFNSITINPSWTPPYSIIKNELLPAYQRDPKSLKRQGFELLSGSRNAPQKLPWSEVSSLKQVLKSHRLTQRPGNNNALGKARLNLVNSNAIYLHDTPNRKLFRRANRALSHGCIRVGNIDHLLTYLSEQAPRATRNAVQAALQSGDPLTRRIRNKTEVYIVYMPAWPNPDGSLSIATDIYNII
ncbi:Putative peptidoglycan binding domain-containing protein [Ferrimonas sediminum]|uniref:Putative peptidoglycan binding domain-containing protein n=1 Tax=Ferrimonas sediminum TaxID=718193 RepID=A0A1G8YEV0_9GAMM|nr:L,D-transpeptidase family protein [Ferrimonas sediminum]SDK01241.1 Putative peptidoglycan binding domain-containing protein [Ferrimonas sediminum]